MAALKNQKHVCSRKRFLGFVTADARPELDAPEPKQTGRARARGGLQRRFYLSEGDDLKCRRINPLGFHQVLNGQAECVDAPKAIDIPEVQKQTSGSRRQWFNQRERLI